LTITPSSAVDSFNIGTETPLSSTSTLVSTPESESVPTTPSIKTNDPNSQRKKSSNNKATTKGSTKDESTEADLVKLSAEKGKSKNGEASAAKEKEGTTGWPSRPPFLKLTTKKDSDDNYIYASELTWEEKQAYRANFLREYLSETKQCIPHVRRLYMMIYRISPWRAIALLVSSVLMGMFPALRLQTRGNFIGMVRTSFPH
jgi:hypothetical protein